MTPASLKSYTQKDLAQMAKQGGVRGWHSMRKDQLVKALVAAATAKIKAKQRAVKKPVAVRGPATTRTAAVTARSSVGAAKRTVSAAARNGSHVAVPARKATSTRVLKHLSQVKTKLDRMKNLSVGDDTNKAGQSPKDRVVVMVRDPFWLHAYWQITRQSVERAQAAMAQEWHIARPVLRLLEVNEGGTTSASERVVTDIAVHGGVNNWYLHVDEPPKSYRVEIGYLSGSGRFHGIARSNIVTTPEPGGSDGLDENWTDVAQNFDRIYAMSGGYAAEGTSSVELQELFEERLRRPMGGPMQTRYGNGVAALLGTNRALKLDVEAELVVFGSTAPNSHLTLRGEPVKLRSDGSFTVRLSLPNQRQVIPVVASTADGGEQRTVVLAIERNTKVMEPVLREQNE